MIKKTWNKISLIINGNVSALGKYMSSSVCCCSRDVFSRDHAFEPYNVRPQYGVVRVTIQRTRGYILMTKIIDEHSSNANHTVFFLRYWGLES